MLSSMHGIFEIKVWGLQLEIYVANHLGKKQSQHSTIAIILLLMYTDVICKVAVALEC